MMPSIFSGGGGCGEQRDDDHRQHAEHPRRAARGADRSCTGWSHVDVLERVEDQERGEREAEDDRPDGGRRVGATPEQAEREDHRERRRDEEEDALELHVERLALQAVVVSRRAR